jgi:hypothetical protein
MEQDYSNAFGGLYETSSSSLLYGIGQGSTSDTDIWGVIHVDITISPRAPVGHHANTAMAGARSTAINWQCLARMFFRDPNYYLIRSHKSSLVMFNSTHFAYLIRLSQLSPTGSHRLS